jgi:tetratricopeptide (TPR) repeat protein
VVTFALRSRRVGRDPLTRVKQDIADCYRRVMLVYYHRNERLTCLAIALAGLNIAEAVDDRLHRAQFYASCAPGAGVMGLPRLGERYIEMANRLLADLDDPATITWVQQTSAWFYCGLGGNWERAQTFIDSALDAAQVAGLRRIYDEELQVRAVSRWPEPFPKRMELWARAQASGAERGDREVEIWSRGIGAGTVLASGRTEEAIALLEPAAAMFRPESSRSGYVKVYGTLCLAYLRAGRQDDGIAALHRALQAGDEALPVLVSMFDGYANTVEACLELWASGDTEWRRPAKRSLKYLDKLARPFTVARPRALLYAGRIQLLDGRQRRARRLWKRSLDLATRLDLPYEIGRVHAELGLLDRSVGNEVAAARHMDEARALFVRLEAGFDLARIDASA